MKRRTKLNRLQRIIHLLGLLQGGRRHNALSLAEACGVTKRTIFRDLESLREAEVPLVYDTEHQLYSIPNQHFLAPTQFTAEEAMAVVVLCHELGDEQRLPFLADARNAAVKIENSLPQRIREQMRAYVHAVNIRLGSMNPLAGMRELYTQLLEAIAKQKSLRLEYDSFSEKKAFSTKFHPYRLVFSLHSWYVVGRSSLHREVRTLNVSRIHRLEMLDEKFRQPQGFSLDRYFGNAWRMIPEPGADRRVILRFNQLVARNVAEVQWHPTQRCTFEAAGSLLYEVRISGLQEITWWILGYGDQVEVLEPLELRDLIAQRLQQALRKYT
jgi:proteasome accessory factor B